jgi:hypothetical protein
MLRCMRSASSLAALVAIALAYAASFSGAFIFDDRVLLIERPEIENFSPFLQKLMAFGGEDTVAAGRPVVAASLMLNVAFDRGVRTAWAYHAVNLAIHLVTAWLVFAVLRRTFERLPRLRAVAARLAFACALLWALHPLHTAAITCIVQRAELLMSMFLMLALYAAIRAVESSSRALVWSCASVLACLLAAMSKEVGYAVPLLIVLYDRTFLQDAVRAGRARRFGLYAGLFASWLVLGAILVTGRHAASIGLSMNGLTPLNYLLTQGNAIAHYLRLVFWPDPLVLDYGWPVVAVDTLADVPAHLGEFAPSFALVACLGVATIVGVARRATWGFGGAWFFLLLAPSSSIIPIATEIMADHRMYLPSLPVITGAVLLVHAVLERLQAGAGARRVQMLAAACFVLVAVSEALMTDAQNRLYASDELMWSHNLLATPDNPRVLLNLASVLRAHAHPGAAALLLERAERASRATERPRHVFLDQIVASRADLARTLESERAANR